MESIKGNAVQGIYGFATLMSPNKDKMVSVVPTAWIADQMETGHHDNHNGPKSH